VGSLAVARVAFEQAVQSYGNPDLEVAEDMEFTNNHYAEVKEKNAGIRAMELLINRPGSQVYPEPGPNMMWNTKYGMMAGGYGGQGPMMGPGGQGMMNGYGPGMMGGYGPNTMQGPSSGEPSQGTLANQMPVSPKRARKIADAYLSRVSPGTQAETPREFYG
jgi:hypothetical protein